MDGGTTSFATERAHLTSPRTLVAAGLLAAALVVSGAYVLLGLGHQVIDRAAAGWLGNAVILTAAVVCLVRSQMQAQDRFAWLLLGAGLAVWRLSDILAGTVFGAGSPMTCATDGLYIAFYLLSFASLALFANAHVRRLPRPVWLDGAIGALTVAAVWSMLILQPSGVLAPDKARWPALGYALSDLTLAALVVGLGAASRWRLGRAVPLLSAGFVAAAVADSFYAAAGPAGPNPAVSALWPVASILFASAAWQPLREASYAPGGPRMLVAPVGMGAVALAMLILHEPLGVGELAAVLSAASLAAVILRVAVELTSSERARRALANEAAKLRAAESRLEEANRLAGFGHWEWEVEADRVTASTELYRITGIEPGPIPLATFLEVIHPEDRRRVEGVIADAMERTQPLAYDARIVRPDGAERVLQVRGMLSPSRAGTWMLGTAQDITERRAREQALRRSITRRETTERFLVTLMDSLAEGLCTIDEMGCVTSANPTATELLGYPKGEMEGLRLHEAFHPSCDGTEPRCELAGLHREARQLRGHEATVARRDGQAIDIAYSASPFATEQGRGTVIVFQDVSERKAEERDLRRRLESLATVARTRTALEEGRLVLFSQPIVDIATGRRVEEELLIRMLDENGALVPPGEFLPAVEEHGFIRELDRWVVRRAALLASTGRRVGINLSGKSVGDRELLRVVEEAIATHGLDPELLIFEITETALTSDIDRAEDFTRRLTDLGCRLALDDFGTGYASFTYLKRLPISYLKIDREFIQQIRDDPANQHLVRAVVGLARDFGQRTIAEGVEDEDSLEFVRLLGVDYVQGFLFGRPRPVAADSHPKRQGSNDPGAPAGAPSWKSAASPPTTTLAVTRVLSQSGIRGMGASARTARPSLG